MRLNAVWLALALLAAACGDSMQGPPGGGSDAGASEPDGGLCALSARDNCCFDDEDCKGSLGTRCYAATCVADGEGRCEIPAAAGMCWTDADCAGHTCRGATICPCGAFCVIADEPGTCASKSSQE